MYGDGSPVEAKILAYELPGCDMQVDAQLSEMLQLAMNSPERPASYTLPSQDDLSLRQSFGWGCFCGRGEGLQRRFLRDNVQVLKVGKP